MPWGGFVKSHCCISSGSIDIFIPRPQLILSPVKFSLYFILYNGLYYTWNMALLESTKQSAITVHVNGPACHVYMYPPSMHLILSAKSHHIFGGGMNEVKWQAWELGLHTCSYQGSCVLAFHQEINCP